MSNDKKMYDVAIIGGGPAGVAAAVYCARKKLNTIIITKEFGGQSVVSDDIQNWIGEISISGVDLAKKFEDHVKHFSDDIEIKESEEVKNIEELSCTDRDSTRVCDFKITTDKEEYLAKSLIIASGARRRKLGVPGEEEYNGKGVAYCSTCDAPLFKDKVVAVIGGGNSGLEAVVDLEPYASKIYLLERSDSLKGDKVTQEKINAMEKSEILYNAQVQSISGETLVTGLTYTDTKENEDKELELGGVFVEIGSVPNSEIVKGLVDIDDHGQIIINAKHASTSHDGIFAAGDVTDDPYKQNNISAGDGVRAALAAYQYIQEIKKTSPAEEN